MKIKNMFLTTTQKTSKNYVQGHILDTPQAGCCGFSSCGFQLSPSKCDSCHPGGHWHPGGMTGSQVGKPDKVVAGDNMLHPIRCKINKLSYTYISIYSL